MESASTADVELVSLRGHQSDEDEGLEKVQDQESIAPFEERPRKTGHSLSTLKSLCCCVCPGRSRKFWNPSSIRVESSLRYAETAGARESLRIMTELKKLR